MFNFKKITYSGITVNVIEAKKDSNEIFQVSVIGDEYNTSTAKRYCGDFKDEILEREGWEKVGLVNGGLFFSEGETTFGVGIEKSRGIVNENDDASKDGVMTLYHDDETLYIYTQAWVRANLNNYRGAVTGAFGLLNNGSRDQRGSVENSGQYNTKSGRTIIGKKSDGTMVFASFEGQTGASGLTGYQTYELAKYLGLYNAVCMDGGGSVYMEHNHTKIINTSRLVKNGVALYRKKLDTNSIKVGDKVIFKQYTISEINGSKAKISELDLWVNLSDLNKL